MKKLQTASSPGFPIEKKLAIVAVHTAAETSAWLRNDLSSEAAVNLTGLLERVEATLDSPAGTNVAPQATAFLNEANARGRRLLYTAFALGCALIAFASRAVIATASILRRGRGGRGT